MENYLFDLYGTLVDIHTEEGDPRLWEEVAGFLAPDGARYDPRDLAEKYRDGVRRMEARAAAQAGPGAAVEIDLEPLFRSFYTDAGVEAQPWQVRSLAWEFRRHSLRKLRLFPGAAEVLRDLRAAGKRVFLLSNAQVLFTRPELELLGLANAFDGTLLSSEAGRKKPDPAFFHALMDRYGLDPDSSVMVGNDDEADCRGAARAGLRSMYIRTEQSPPLSGPLPEGCVVLGDITEVLK